MIWGYHYFWKHPYIHTSIHIVYLHSFISHEQQQHLITKHHTILIGDWSLASRLFWEVQIGISITHLTIHQNCQLFSWVKLLEHAAWQCLCVNYCRNYCRKLHSAATCANLSVLGRIPSHSLVHQDLYCHKFTPIPSFHINYVSAYHYHTIYIYTYIKTKDLYYPP